MYPLLGKVNWIVWAVPLSRLPLCGAAVQFLRLELGGEAEDNPLYPIDEIRTSASVELGDEREELGEQLDGVLLGGIAGDERRKVEGGDLLLG